MTTTPIAAASSIGELVARARLSAGDSHTVFRALLDTLARPGQVLALPPDLAARVPPAVLALLALADVEISVAVLADPPPVGEGLWLEVVRSVTGAGPAALPRAQMVAALRAPTASEVMVLERGTAEAPELGARVSLACRSLHPGRTAVHETTTLVEVRGPGVDGEQAFRVDGLAAELIEAIGEANREPPAGIDCWLVADDGAVVGLPRSASCRVQPPAGAQRKAG
ncbi:hypothetical protein BH20ACT2_BH20ACT2_06850 [soil metagenome]